MQRVLRITGLPDAALDAAAAFHADWRAQADALIREGGDVVLIMPPAPRDHEDWRRGMVRDLARAHAPSRVNLVVGNDENAVAAALSYLEQAPGVTGQMLKLAGHASPDRAE